MRRLTLDQARRIALGAQGLACARPAGRIDVRHFRRVVSDVNVVQLDSVNVLARAHYLPFWSRLGAYPRDALDDWLWRSGEMYEFWAHVASLSPIEQYPLLRHRMTARTHWPRVAKVVEEHPGYIDTVREHIEEHGPTSVSTLADPGQRTGPWWGVPRGRTALDWLFLTGASAVHDRTGNFVTSYDLAERIIPAEVLAADEVPRLDAVRELLVLAAQSHGLGTATDLADYYRIRMPEARPAFADLVASGRLVEVEVDGWRRTYLDPEAVAPRSIGARTLLSPFDPVVWFRDRAERLFDFHYRIEIYVPEPQRQYGYYVLPFLLGDAIVARVDLKLDRAASRLLVKGAFAEPGVDCDHVGRELAAELTDLAAWLDADDIAIAPNGDLAPHLTRAVA